MKAELEALGGVLGGVLSQYSHGLQAATKARLGAAPTFLAGAFASLIRNAEQRAVVVPSNAPGGVVFTGSGETEPAEALAHAMLGVPATVHGIGGVPSTGGRDGVCGSSDGGSVGCEAKTGAE